MFESLEGNRRRKAADRYLALMLSLFIHGLAVLFLVILPLMYFRILPGVDLLTILVAAPDPPPAPPPPIALAPQQEHRPAGKDFRIAGVDVPPVEIPKGVSAPLNEPPGIIEAAGVVGFGPGLSWGGGLTGSGIVGNLAASLVAPPAPAPPPPKPKIKPMPVGGKVQEAKLIRRVLPVYPDLAKRARVSGEVSLEVTVDEEGNVIDVVVLKGHPLLTGAAVLAVKDWKYSPTLLNGEPVPVIAAVTVSFRLN